MTMRNAHCRAASPYSQQVKCHRGTIAVDVHNFIAFFLDQCCQCGHIAGQLFFTGRQLIYAADRFQLRLDIRTAAFTQCKAHQIFPCRYAGYPEQDLCQTVHGKPCCCDQQNLLHGRLPFFCSIVSHIIPIFSNFFARSEVMMQLLFLPDFFRALFVKPIIGSVYNHLPYS